MSATPVDKLTSARRESTRCGLLAYGAVQAGADAIAGLRPPAKYCEHLPANLLRHADPQTTVSLAAVMKAIGDFELDPAAFATWGVLAAPRWFGRGGTAAELHRINRRGARSVFPVAVPNFSLHALSGTISMFLRAHGPNFGVGGGPTHVADGLFAAAAFLADSSLPGAWLTVSQWLPESPVDSRGDYGSAGVCHAVALALVPQVENQSEAHLHVSFGQSTSAEPVDVPDLIAWLTAAPASPGAWSCSVADACVIELSGVPERPARPAVPFPAAAVQDPSGKELREAG